MSVKEKQLTNFKEYRENVDKCIAIIKSDRKHKTIGKVINVKMPQYGRNGRKGIIITLEYKTKDNVLKVGKQYMDFPNNYPGINDEVDIYYLDDNYDFVYIDEMQFIDKNDSTFIDSEQKSNLFIKEIRPVIISIIMCIVLSLIAAISLNKYVILISTLFQFILLGVNLKQTQNPIILIYGIPYLINLVAMIYYYINIIDLDYIAYLLITLHITFVVSLLLCQNTLKQKRGKK